MIRNNTLILIMLLIIVMLTILGIHGCQKRTAVETKVLEIPAKPEPVFYLFGSWDYKQSTVGGICDGVTKEATVFFDVNADDVIHKVVLDGIFYGIESGLCIQTEYDLVEIDTLTSISNEQTRETLETGIRLVNTTTNTSIKNLKASQSSISFEYINTDNQWINTITLTKSLNN